MGFGTYIGENKNNDSNGPGHTVNCRCAVVLPRRAFYQPCPDAMPLEVTVLSNTAERLAVVEAVRSLPFAVFTRFGVWHTNVSPVPAEHVRLLAVRA